VLNIAIESVVAAAGDSKGGPRLTRKMVEGIVW
jgi:hypothetical protein